MNSGAGLSDLSNVGLFNVSGVTPDSYTGDGAEHYILSTDISGCSAGSYYIGVSEAQYRVLIHKVWLE